MSDFDAIAAAISDDESELVVKWLLVAEIAGENDSHHLITMSSGNVMLWDAVGMLTAANDSAREQMGSMFDEGDEE